MTSLYSCRHSGDQYRISKFDSHFDLESSYLCTETECECPAGHRPTCRHRAMLPKFIARNAIGTDWFFDYDRGGWVQSGIVIQEMVDPVDVHNAIAEAVGEPTIEPSPSPSPRPSSLPLQRRRI